MRFRRPLLLITLGVLSCGGREDAGDGTGGTTPADAGGGAEPYLEGLRTPPGTRISRSRFEPRPSECATDSECSESSAGAACTTLEGSYRVCVPVARVATAPSSNPSADECDSTRPCAAGSCFEALVLPSGQCGLGGASVQNACLADTCQSDCDCAGGICGPAGLTSNESISGGGVRQCFRADCRDDADCSLEQGGVCAFVPSSCGSPIVGRGFRPAQMACVYPGGCLRDSDCGDGACIIVDGTAVCLSAQN
jgi:hypothetical protein